MKYVPKLKDSEINESHKIFEEKQAYYKEQGLDFQKNREFILEKTGRLEGSILEIGSGKGKTAISLAKAGYDLSSIDADEEMLKIAAQNIVYEKLLSNVTLYLMNAYDLKFNDNSFDNIFMIEALHHIDDLDGVLSEIDRVLRKGGQLVLADFNKIGMKIVDNSHAREGNKHVNSFVGEEAVIKWLSSRSYQINRYNDKCHWVAIAIKN